MATHEFVITIPPKEVLYKYVVFDVSGDNEPLGKLTVSQGGLGWYPANAPLERNLSWEQFDQMIGKHFGKR